MAVTDRSVDRADGLPAPIAAPRGFRPASRRRVRLAAGAVLAAVGIGGNVLLYTSLDDSVEVVQVATNVRAGQQITSADLRIVEVDVDASVPVVTADRLGTLIGQYASVYIAAGTLMVDVLVQPDPLVAPGRSVIAIELRPGRVPNGIVERSRVQLIIVGPANDAALVAEARVVSLIRSAEDGSGESSMSFEVDDAVAPTLASADDVRVVLLDPAVDPALPPAGAPGPASTEPPAPPPTAAPAPGATTPTTARAATTTIATTTSTVAPAATTAAPIVTAAPAVPATTGAAP